MKGKLLYVASHLVLVGVGAAFPSVSSLPLWACVFTCLAGRFLLGQGSYVKMLACPLSGFAAVYLGMHFNRGAETLLTVLATLALVVVSVQPQPDGGHPIGSR